MLQGTFETLSLPEVFGLLAGARKSGALYLEAGEVAGLVHLADGHCHAVDSTEQRGPLQDGGDLLVRLVSLCFASMCQETGSFRFEADEPAPWSCPERVELSDALVEADGLLKQWREILRVIPSLECRPCLLETLEVEELVLDRERWVLLVAIDGRRTVREIVERTARPVMDVGQALLELVEAGAVGVVDPAAARAPMDTDEVPAPEVPVFEVQAPEVPVFEVPEPDVPAPENVSAFPATEVPVPEAAVPEVPAPSAPVLTIVPEAAPPPEAEPQPQVDSAVADVPSGGTPAPVVEANGSEPPDRGAFLRLFSGLRES